MWLRIVALSSILLFTACGKSPATGGDAASASTSTTDDGCPKDLLAARGTPCTTENKTCGTSPSGFTHFIMCSRGKWTEMNAPPPPPPPPPRASESH